MKRRRCESSSQFTQSRIVAMLWSIRVLTYVSKVARNRKCMRSVGMISDRIIATSCLHSRRTFCARFFVFRGRLNLRNVDTDIFIAFLPPWSSSSPISSENSAPGLPWDHVLPVESLWFRLCVFYYTLETLFIRCSRTVYKKPCKKSRKTIGLRHSARLGIGDRKRQLETRAAGDDIF